MNPKAKFFVIILFLLIAVGAGTSVYFYTLAKNPGKVAQKEVNKTLEEVGRLIILPEGETPTVATVSDINPLKDQPFFLLAEKGDKVLIYTTAQKAYLYRPSLGKLVEVSPITTNVQPQD
jgi:hypothetical protein